MLEAVSGIGSGQLALNLLIYAEGFVDREIAVRVSGELPSGGVGFAVLPTA